MGKLVVDVRFMLRGVWVHPDALGASYEWTEKGHTVRLALPQHPSDFIYPNESETVAYPAISQPALIAESGRALSIDVVKVEVEVGAETSIEEKRAAKDAYESSIDEQKWQEFESIAGAAWERGHSIAERAAARWLSHIRISIKQPWLGVDVDPLEQYGRSYLIDASAPGETMLAYGPIQSASVRSGLTALSIAELSTIQEDLASGREPSIAETLLSDALFLAQESEVIDGQRAVLSVASACEIKTKASLRQACRPDNQELLDLVINRMSNLPGLLKEPYAAVFGKPLSEEDSALFKRVQRIARLRDLVIHRGESVDKEEAWQLAIAGRQLFELLAQKLSK